MYSCQHNTLVSDITHAISQNDVTGELEDYKTKAMTITFFHYYKYYYTIDPYTNIHILNKALNYSPTKLSLIESLPRTSAFLLYLQKTLKIPFNILTKWIPDVTCQSIYAGVCAAEVTLQHITPLLHIVSDDPHSFFEFMVIYNRIWIIGRIDEHLDKCCKGGQTLYCILLTLLNHTDPEIIKHDIPSIVCYIRAKLGLGHRTVVSTSTLDLSMIFRHFKI